MSVVYHIKHVDGRVFDGVSGRDVVKTVDRRGDSSPVVVVYEVKTPGGIVLKLWPEDIESIDAEARS